MYSLHFGRTSRLDSNMCNILIELLPFSHSCDVWFSARVCKRARTSVVPTIGCTEIANIFTQIGHRFPRKFKLIFRNLMVELSSE